MRVLVTGGAGFLGAHLCKALLARGEEVVALDNFATSNRGHSRASGGLPAVHLHQKVTCAHPLRSRVHSMPSPTWPAPRHPTNTCGSRSRRWPSVATEASSSSAWPENNGCRVLLASTSEVYGDPLERPQREEYWGNVNPIGPRSVYDESKRYAEALFMAHRRAPGVNTGIVRIFNTYGPGLRPSDGRVVSNFVAQAIRGEPLTVYGDGRQTRSFCYVSDLIEGLLRMLASD